MLIKLIAVAVVLSWASCSIGCTEVSNSSTGGAVEPPANVLNPVIVAQPGTEEVETEAEVVAH